MSKGRGGLASLFAATLFAGAFLLFWIEPLIAKLLLPLLGGTPSVWNTCMLFFQVMLLAGYAYVLAITKWLGPRQQAGFHLMLLMFAAISLPIGVSAAAAGSVPAQSNPILWLLGILLTTVGFPFFVISATAPLLQKWFSETRHPSARDPYFLYAASNAGSFAALIGFPLLLEPNLRLLEQSALWTKFYGGLVLLMVLCAAVLWKARSARVHSSEEAAASKTETTADTSQTLVDKVTFTRRLRWTLLAFVPSSLVLGVTTYITTDIAAVPLFWVAPLALYLLSFVFVFAKRQVLSRRLMARLLPGAAIVIALILASQFAQPTWLIPAHLFFFFAAAMVCHGQLADERPRPDRLAEYYLWIAVGGVLGGVFNALIAPLLFNIVLEYPIAVVLACLMLPRREGEERGRLELTKLVPRPVLQSGMVLVTAVVALLITQLNMQTSSKALIFVGAGLFPTIVGGRLLTRRPLQFALALGIVIVGGIIFAEATSRTLYRSRNFYGTLRVSRDASGSTNDLHHGTTLHGSQFVDTARRCDPLTYYHSTGPLGLVFDSFNAKPAAPDVAVVGLGTGTTAAYAKPNQNWTFYEINPDVSKVARDERLFSYLKECAPKPSIILGDARLQLQHAPDGHYGLIVLDAFSSESIPVHLLTREAVGLYVSKLAPRGLIAIHISNRHLNLAPVVGDIAQDAGLAALLSQENFLPSPGKNKSRWAVLARNRNDFGALAQAQSWRTLEGRLGRAVWTDDFSNIISVLLIRRKLGLDAGE